MKKTIIRLVPGLMVLSVAALSATAKAGCPDLSGTYHYRSVADNCSVYLLYGQDMRSWQHPHKDRIHFPNTFPEKMNVAGRMEEMSGILLDADSTIEIRQNGCRALELRASRAIGPARHMIDLMPREHERITWRREGLSYEYSERGLGAYFIPYHVYARFSLLIRNDGNLELATSWDDVIIGTRRLGPNMRRCVFFRN